MSRSIRARWTGPRWTGLRWTGPRRTGPRRTGRPRWTGLVAAILAATFLLAPIGGAGLALAQDHGGEEHIAPGEHGSQDGEHGTTEHGTTPGADHEGGEHHGEWDFGKLTWSIINFVVWLGALVYLGRKPMSEFLAQRREQVAHQLEEARRLKEEAERTYKEYSERLEQLDTERASLIAEMRAAGETERKRLLEEAEDKAARMRKDAQFLIDQQVKQLRADLQREAIEAAVLAATEMLSSQAKAGDQSRLADEYLEGLGEAFQDDQEAA